MTSQQIREPEWEDPLPFLRDARNSLVQFGRLQDELAPRDAHREPVTDEREFYEAMSQGLRAVVEDYRERHPDAKVELVAYIRSVDGRVDLLLRTDGQVPGEDQLVQLTSATSAADRAGLRVVSEVLVASHSKR